MLADVMTRNDEDVSARIRAAAGVARKSGAAVAKAAGISYSTYRRRMDDPSGWTIEQLRRVAAFLDVPLSRLTQED